MDLVYQNANYSVGLLTTPFITQDDVDLLASLIKSSRFCPDLSECQLDQSVNVQKVHALVTKILSDPRWS